MADIVNIDRATFLKERLLTKRLTNFINSVSLLV